VDELWSRLLLVPPEVDQLITETAEGVLPQAPAFEALDERRAAVRLLDGAPVHGARDGDASAGVPETPERGQWMSATPAASPSQEQRASAGP
jgi:hypothetical protein